MNKRKIAIAITGASGSIYAKVLFDKLSLLKDQIADLGIVMSDNAKDVWHHELGNSSFNEYGFKFFDKEILPHLLHRVLLVLIR